MTLFPGCFTPRKRPLVSVGLYESWKYSVEIRTNLCPCQEFKPDSVWPRASPLTTLTELMCSSVLSNVGIQYHIKGPC
jgi:hypothetical protein